MVEDLEKYKDSFLSEAKELIASMNTALLKLEKEPKNTEHVGEIFRAAHTLKSMAATMHYDEMAKLCHAVEDVLDLIRAKKLDASACVDSLYDSFDAFEATLRELMKGKTEVQASHLVHRLESFKGGEKASSPRPEIQTGPQGEGVNEIVGKIQSIDVKVEKLDSLMNLSEEFLIIKMRLDGLKESIDVPEYMAAVDTLGRLVGEMQYSVMQARTVPIGFVFNRFPRMVRDLAKAQKKQVALETKGGDLELDRGVIDEIGESLVHLLRNAVDHGMETPEERKKLGKPALGTIKLTATGTKNFAVIEVQDDGAGLDLEAIKAKALKRGNVSESATREELMNLVFSGVSTSQKVTAVSGRGLGLNIVKTKIESLGGTIRVESEPRKGIKFILEIPLTLAVIKTLFVQIGMKPYAIPFANIERLVTVDSKDIKGMLDYEAVVIEGEDIPLARLGQIFGVATKSLDKQPIVVVKKGDESLGLAVDELLSTQEIVIKPLHRTVKENPYFAGTATLGSGEAILVLDVAGLVLSKRDVQTTLKGDES